MDPYKRFETRLGLRFPNTFWSVSTSSRSVYVGAFAGPLEISGLPHFSVQLKGAPESAEEWMALEQKIIQAYTTLLA